MLCSDVFLFLWTKRASSIRSFALSFQPQPAVAGLAVKVPPWGRLFLRAEKGQAKVIAVPVFPCRASMALSSEVMIAFLPGSARTNFMAA